jgi:hypothetical protein
VTGKVTQANPLVNNIITEQNKDFPGSKSAKLPTHDLSREMCPENTQVSKRTMFCYTTTNEWQVS